MIWSRRISAWVLLVVSAVAPTLLVSSTHATAEPSRAPSSGDVCPLSGASGKSTLSWDEVMQRMHAREAACPHAAAAARGCPHGRSLAAPSADEKGTWL